MTGQLLRFQTLKRIIEHVLIVFVSVEHIGWLPAALLKMVDLPDVGVQELKILLVKKYGKLTVQSLHNIKNSGSYWLCRCDCGNQTVVRQGALTSKQTKSCGCISCPNLVDSKVGHLTVLRKVQKRKNQKQKWECGCECGKIIEVTTYYLKNNKIKSCGCKSYALKGEDHPNWNPNLTEEDRLRRTHNRKRDEEWSSKVFVRDDYTCKICKTRGSKLNAHHLDGWHWCVERRYDLDNGVTLCECCHKEFHKIYGNRDNTAEEFIEFWLCKQHYD